MAEMTISEKQQLIATELNNLENWDDKFSYIIDKGESMPDYPPHLKTDEYLIRECQSKLWLYCTYTDDKIQLYAHSQTVIVRGIVGIFWELYSGATPAEIINTPITFLEKAGLLRLFSNRVTGIQGILIKINEYASQYK